MSHLPPPGKGVCVLFFGSLGLGKGEALAVRVRVGGRMDMLCGFVHLSYLDMFHSTFVRRGPSQDPVSIRKQTLTCCCLCSPEKVPQLP